MSGEKEVSKEFSSGWQKGYEAGLFSGEEYLDLYKMRVEEIIIAMEFGVYGFDEEFTQKLLRKLGLGKMGEQLRFTAGEAIKENDAVYIKEKDGKLYRSNAAATTLENEKEMTFKEKFQRLTVYVPENFRTINDLQNAEFCFKWMVEEQCLSKQFVKEVIEKLKKQDWSTNEGDKGLVNAVVYDLLKRLGLDRNVTGRKDE